MASLTVLSASAASALIAAIWQGALLALGVALLLRIFPAITASARSVIWFAAFALIVLLHFTPSFTHPALSPRNYQPFYLDLRWSIAILAIWAVFSLFRAIQLIRSALALRKISNNSTPVEAPPCCEELLHRHIRPVKLCVSNEIDRPSVAGFFSPRILLPPQLLAELSANELKQVLLHELEHLRRRDDWTNLLQKVVLVLFPLNPVLFWVERRLCAERELACDDQVLRRTGARKAYAICLTHLAEHTLLHRSLTLALGAWQHQSELARRVTRILTAPARALNPRQTAALVATLLVAASAATVELTHAPQLISFLPAPVAFEAQYTPTLRAPHATLTSAVMPAPRSGQTAEATTRPPRSISAVAHIPQRPAQVNTFAHHHIQPHQQWMTLTSFELPEPQDQPVYTAPRPQPMMHLTLTVADPNQFQYTAIPVRGGWIIVQLQPATLTITL